MLEVSDCHRRMCFFIGHSLQFSMSCSKRHCGRGFCVRHALRLNVLLSKHRRRLAFLGPRQAQRCLHSFFEVQHPNVLASFHTMQTGMELGNFLTQCLLR